jgi:hypothetical protein
VTGAENRIDNLAAYKRLHVVCADLDALAELCWSPTARTAIRVCSTLVRRVASGLYQSSLRDSAE